MTKTYSVVLLYPQDATSDYGADIYVSAAYGCSTIASAVELVQKEASENVTDRDGTPLFAPSDFRCILVLDGAVKCVGDAEGFDDDSDRDEGLCDTADRDYREALR
jgi:hypothetical protein